MSAEMTQPTIDFLILTDHAEAINGKLYLMGGGWDVRTIYDFSQPTPLTMALAVLVPWTATNQRHHLRLRIEDADGRQLAEMKADFAAGRPPQMTAGTTQRVSLVLHLGLVLAGPGVYAVVAEMNGRDQKRTTFTAVVPPPHETPGPTDPRA